MKLHVQWSKAILLRDGKKEENNIYSVDLSKLPQTSGIYVLGRRWGSDFEALYVGKASKVRGRVKSQLNNLGLMQHLKNAKGGKRLVLHGRIITKPGQQLDKCMVLVERAMIRYFLSEGHDLVNKQGTRIRRHEITSDGKHPKKLIPRAMFLERAKRE